ncbi:hypothetical protein C0995_006489 [Termitomyces sp. Mi166|nr:hypothetical protein C0995_006489 [Termitomyces sp. Mi166\
MAPNATVAYPPTTAQSARASASDKVVSEQPSAAERMSLDGPSSTKGEARRLRGGCIPCPGTYLARKGRLQWTDGRYIVVNGLPGNCQRCDAELRSAEGFLIALLARLLQCQSYLTAE